MKKILLLSILIHSLVSCSREEPAPGLAATCQLTSVIDSLSGTQMLIGYEYDGNGRLKKVIPDPSVPVNYFSYTYETGRIIQQIHSENNQPSPTVIYSLNDLGYAASSLSTFSNDIGGLDSAFTSFFYNSRSQIDSVNRVVRRAGAILLKKSYRHIFDVYGRVASVRLYSADNMTTDTYEYSTTSPSVKYNPWMYNPEIYAHPGVNFFGKQLSDKVPVIKNNQTTKASVFVNGSGYIKYYRDGNLPVGMATRIFKYSNCK
jgi:hypothetical protein